MSHLTGTITESTLNYIGSVSKYPLFARADIVNALKAGKMAVIAEGKVVEIHPDGFKVAGEYDDHIRSITVLAGIPNFMLCKFYMRTMPNSQEKTMYVA